MTASAEQIHQSLEAVARLRQLRATNPPLAAAATAVKRFQAQRFEATYPDLLTNPRYRPAAGFFLDEIYSDKDYAERDQQFARIANSIAKLFPQSVVHTAAAMADVHALTEQLDDAMARAYLALPKGVGGHPGQINAAQYVTCWRQVCGLPDRQRQLDLVLALGQSLDSLTRKPGLRTLLKLMRGPAVAAGLSSLQRFLEAGFDAFQTMRGADEFLKLIAEREGHWMARLFEGDAALCEAKLTQLLTGN